MPQAKIRAQQAANSTALAWGFGGVSVGIKNNLLGVWILYYYSEVLGVDAYLVALALAVALVVDAISDPLVGIWSDRTRSRWGRRHPFIYAAIAPFTLSYYFILQDPGDASSNEIFFRLLILMLVMRLSMTFYEVPRNALAPELSKDYDQRNKLAGYSSAFGWFGGAVISHYVMSAYLLGDSFSDANGYELLGFWGGLWLFIGTVVSSLGTHHKIPDLHEPAPRSANLQKLFLEIKETLSNKNWAVLFLAGCIFAIQVGADTGAGTYYNEYLWEWQPSDIAIFAAFQALSVIAISLAAPALTVGRNKKHIAVSVFLLAVITSPLPFFLRLIDPYFAFATFPSNGTDMLWWTLLIHACATASLSALGFIYVASMQMELVEAVQVKTGRRDEALLGTASSMMHKLIGAGGTLLAGMIISISGFDNPDLTYAAKTTDAIATFSWIHVAFSFFLPLCSTCVIMFYSIDREGHLERLESLGYTKKEVS